MNWIILAGNLAFIYIWGYKNWRDADYNTSAWWFDAYGHMIFGFCWALILLYWAKRYLFWLYIPIPKWFLALVIILVVSALETLVWENFEFGVWDSWIQPAHPYLPKAQKGSEDTMMDINFTATAALWAMIFWGAYRKFCTWKWPNEAAEEASEEMLEREKLNATEILLMQKGHKKEIGARIKAFWDNFLENLREK